MATGTSRAFARKAASGVLAASLLAGALVALLMRAPGSSGLRAPRAAQAPSAASTGHFPALAASRAPRGWAMATIASGGATLFHPANWKQISGDRGTISFALRDRRARYLAYLNVTPRQGAEQPAGWPSFRVTRNREEGDRKVRRVASAENLRFRDARASCVIDDYVSRVGANRYRELACIVTGRRFIDVFVGATLRASWAALGGSVERAATSLIQR
jgi:hypothetical protein